MFSQNHSKSLGLALAGLVMVGCERTQEATVPPATSGNTSESDSNVRATLSQALQPAQASMAVVHAHLEIAHDALEGSAANAAQLPRKRLTERATEHVDAALTLWTNQPHQIKQDASLGVIAEIANELHQKKNQLTDGEARSLATKCEHGATVLREKFGSMPFTTSNTERQ